MDMAKIGSPLLVVKVCALILCVKTGYRYHPTLTSYVSWLAMYPAHHCGNGLALGLRPDGEALPPPSRNVRKQRAKKRSAPPGETGYYTTSHVTIVIWKRVVNQNHAKFSLQPLGNNSTRHPVRPLKCSSPKRLPLPPRRLKTEVHFRDHRLLKISSGSSFSAAEANRTTEEPSQDALDGLASHQLVGSLVSLPQLLPVRATSWDRRAVDQDQPRPYYHKDVPMWTAEEKSSLLCGGPPCVVSVYQYGASPKGTCQPPREGPESLPLRVPA